MTQEVENLVLEHLRAMRHSLRRLELDVSDIKIRVSATERHLGEQQLQMSAINICLDHLDERVSRIEKRLELVDA